MRVKHGRRPELAAPLTDSRWGRSARIGDFPARGNIPLSQGTGDYQSAHPQDWTVYVQRTPPVENLYLNPEGNWLLNIEFGSGGAQFKDVLPLDPGGEYVLHYASATPPRIWLAYGNPVGTYDEDVVTCTVAPGRPTSVKIPGLCAVDGTFAGEGGVINAWYKILDIPFGAVGFYFRSFALMTAPVQGPVWELPNTMACPAITAPPYASAAALQSAIAPWYIAQQNPPATQSPDDLVATDILRTGQQFAPLSGAWGAQRKLILLGSPTPVMTGSGATAVSVRTHYQWEIIR